MKDSGGVTDGRQLECHANNFHVSNGFSSHGVAGVLMGQGGERTWKKWQKQLIDYSRNVVESRQIKCWTKIYNKDNYLLSAYQFLKTADHTNTSQIYSIQKDKQHSTNTQTNQLHNVNTCLLSLTLIIRWTCQLRMIRFKREIIQFPPCLHYMV